MQHFFSSQRLQIPDSLDLINIEAEKAIAEKAIMEKVTMGKNEIVHKRRPMLALSYDDGKVEEYTKTYQVHKTFGVPGTFAPITERLNTDGYLSTEQLLEMYNDGHEIASHGYNHIQIGPGSGVRNLAAPAAIGDEILFYAGELSWFVGGLRKFPVYAWIKEGETSEKITIVDQAYLEPPQMHLESPLQNAYTTDAILFHDSPTLLREIRDSKLALEELGINCKGIQYPGGGHDFVSRRLCAMFYDYGRATDHYSEPNIIVPPIIKPYSLGSKDFATNFLTDLEITTMLDNTVVVNGLLLLHGHGFHTNLTEARISFVITEALSRGIEIVTISEGLKVFGNSYMNGDIEENKSLVVGCEGDTLIKPILQSPNSTMYRLKVDDSGVLSTEAI